MNTRQRITAVFVLVVSWVVSGCGQGQSFVPTMTPTAMITPTLTETPTSTIIPTATWTATPFPSIKPKDFQVKYYWKEGSVPPPYFYNYVITIGPGDEGEIVFTPDYSKNAPPQWRETFLVNESQLDLLYWRLLEIGALTESWQQSAVIKTGGSSDNMSILVYGQHISIPADVEGDQNARDIGYVYDYIVRLVPDNVWEMLDALHEQYVEDHEEE